MKRKVAVYAPVWGTAYLGTFEVDSDTPDKEIKKIAIRDGDHYISLCHQCSKDNPLVDGVDVDLSELIIEDE